MSTKKASSALLARIAEVTLQELHAGNDYYIVQAPMGMSLNRGHINFLEELTQDRLKDPIFVANYIEISQIVDSIQRSTSTLSLPSDLPGYISDIFPRIISNIKFDSKKLTDIEKKDYHNAIETLYKEFPYIRKDTYNEFCLLRIEVEKMSITKIEMQRASRDDEENIELLSKLENHQEILKAKDILLKSLSKEFLTDENIIKKSERELDEVPSSIKRSLAGMNTLLLTSPTNNQGHIACSFFPSYLMEENWIPLTITAKDIAKENHVDETLNTDMLADDTIESIQLEIQTLACVRPWYWTSLFENKNWTWSISSPAVSTGNTIQNNTLIPGYIHSLIFARNIVVKNKPSAPLNINVVNIKPNLSTSFLIQTLMFSPELHAISPKPSKPLITSTFIMNSSSKTLFAKLNTSFMPKLPTRTIPNRVATFGLSHLIRKNIFKLSVRGQILDENTNKVFQAKVSISGKKIHRITKTSKDGKFMFSDLPLGQYIVNVKRVGFQSFTETIKVPQKNSYLIKLKHIIAHCRLIIRLTEILHDGTQKKYLGDANITIGHNGTNRLESLDSQSETSFLLTPGNYKILLSSTEAEIITPQHVSLHLIKKEHILDFLILRASTLKNTNVQLLGFVCKRVPRSPHKL